MQLNYTQHHILTDTPNDPTFITSYHQQRLQMNEIVNGINEILQEIIEEVNYAD